jgi:excisionase family DNA binding protein
MDTTFYTVEEIADKLSVSAYAVREWIKAGKLNAIKFGRIYRITDEMFNEFIEKNKNN